MSLRETITAKINTTTLAHARLETKLAGVVGDSEDLEHRGYLEGYRDALQWVVTESATINDHEGLEAATAVAQRRLGTKRSTTVREIIAAYLGAAEEPARTTDRLESQIGQPIRDHQADWHTMEGLTRVCYRYDNCPLLKPLAEAAKMTWICQAEPIGIISSNPCSPATGARANTPHSNCGWE